MALCRAVCCAWSDCVAVRIWTTGGWLLPSADASSVAVSNRPVT